MIHDLKIDSQRTMSRAKTPRAPRVRSSPSLFLDLALFASWREDRFWLRPKAALSTLSLCGEHLCETKPIRQGRLGSRGRFCETKPISHRLIVRNKANLPGQGLGDAGRGQLYKQSQTSASWGIWGSGGLSRVILPNKANSPSRPAASAGHLYKQSQFPGLVQKWSF
jgi:hypothetical protein